MLDQHRYTEAMPQTVWRSKTNQDIAANIVGVLTDIVQKLWNLCDVLRDDALALRLRRGLDIGMAEIVS